MNIDIEKSQKEFIKFTENNYLINSNIQIKKQHS